MIKQRSVYDLFCRCLVFVCVCVFAGCRSWICTSPAMTRLTVHRRSTVQFVAWGGRSCVHMFLPLWVYTWHEHIVMVVIWANNYDFGLPHVFRQCGQGTNSTKNIAKRTNNNQNKVASRPTCSMRNKKANRSSTPMQSRTKLDRVLFWTAWGCLVGLLFCFACCMLVERRLCFGCYLFAWRCFLYCLSLAVGRHIHLPFRVGPNHRKNMEKGIVGPT